MGERLGVRLLTAAEIRVRPRRRRSPYSEKQHYQEYLLQRIEGYKNSIGRDELLRLGDEAAADLQAASEGQFVLTEVLMLESVDRLIMRRLSLRSFPKWRQHFVRMRTAQRTPIHWGLEPHCPVSWLLPRLEPDDAALVIGRGAEPTAYLLAAYDVAVTYVAADIGSVEQVESRMACEALASLFEGFVTPLGPTLPAFLACIRDLDVVVIDLDALADVDPDERCELIADLQARLRAGGVHVLLPTSPRLAPGTLLPHYDGWTIEEGSRRRRRAGALRPPDGLILCRAPCPDDAV